VKVKNIDTKQSPRYAIPPLRKDDSTQCSARIPDEQRSINGIGGDIVQLLIENISEVHYMYLDKNENITTKIVK